MKLNCPFVCQRGISCIWFPGCGETSNPNIHFVDLQNLKTSWLMNCNRNICECFNEFTSSFIASKIFSFLLFVQLELGLYQHHQSFSLHYIFRKTHNSETTPCLWTIFIVLHQSLVKSHDCIKPFITWEESRPM